LEPHPLSNLPFYTPWNPVEIAKYICLEENPQALKRSEQKGCVGYDGEVDALAVGDEII
jgi:hypothetical protein